VCEREENADCVAPIAKCGPPFHAQLTLCPLQLLEMARAWKMQKEAGQGSNPLSLITGATSGAGEEGADDSEGDGEEDVDEGKDAAAVAVDGAEDNDDDE